MTEKEIQLLGFERQDETPESSGAPNKWYYYTLDIEDFCLITNANDQVKDDNWKVYIFDLDGFGFTEFEELQSLINILKKGVLKKDGK